MIVRTALARASQVARAAGIAAGASDKLCRFSSQQLVGDAGSGEVDDNCGCGPDTIGDPFERHRVNNMVNMMRSLSRLTGLVSALCLVAFVLVTSGFACVDSPGRDAMAEMGMARSATNSGAMVHGIAAPLPASAPAPTAPCRFPWAPDGCQSMVPCSPAALASATAAVGHASAAPERIAVGVSLTPLSVTTPPELPPPRA